MIDHRLLYFPTTVLLIDDDKGFLANVGLKLTRTTPFLLSENPESSLKLLLENKDKKTLINKLSERIIESNFVEIEPGYICGKSLLYQQIYDVTRFAHISTVVVDYSMPKMNGKQFCDQLRDSHIRKIMLTGEADYRMAVDMFNDGLIDKFIVKDSPDMMVQLNQSIQKAQYDYFTLLSSELLKSFSFIKDNDIDKNVATLLKDYFYKHNYSEHYLLDRSGSSLFLDKEGQPTWCIMKSIKEIETYCEIAQDNNAPTEIIMSLQSREKVPFFLTDIDDKVPAKNWGPFLHSAQELTNGYYYAFIHKSSTYSLDYARILSHQTYLAA